MYTGYSKDKNTIAMLFDLNERDGYKEIEYLYLFFKLCENLDLKIKFSSTRMALLFDGAPPINDYMIQIEASGSEKPLEKLNKVWENLKNNPEFKKICDDLQKKLEEEQEELMEG